jgi:hypothetical protein
MGLLMVSDISILSSVLIIDVISKSIRRNRRPEERGHSVLYSLSPSFSFLPLTYISFLKFFILLNVVIMQINDTS